MRHSAPKPKALLFDLDGTLMDTAPDFFPTVNTLRKEHGLAPLDDQSIRQQVSNGGRALTCLALAAPDTGSDFFEQQRARLLELYIEHIASKSDLFPDMITLLQTCQNKGIRWGIVTNKPRLYTEILLARLAKRIPILSQCAVLVCPDDVEKTKPHPEPLFLAAKQLNLSPGHCWYLGDHIRDIEAGNAANMFTIATLYGYIEPHDEPHHWQADSMVNTVQDITQLLNKSLNQPANV